MPRTDQTDPTTPTPTTEPAADAPTPQEFADLRTALLDQEETRELAGNWWRRVREARKANRWTVLRLLHAEALNRLDHAKRRKAMAILRVLFRLLGVQV